jgi:hypothetical protein
MDVSSDSGHTIAPANGIEHSALKIRDNGLARAPKREAVTLAVSDDRRVIEFNVDTERDLHFVAPFRVFQPARVVGLGCPGRRPPREIQPDSPLRGFLPLDSCAVWSRLGSRGPDAFA